MIILDLDNCISDDSWRIRLIHWQTENRFLRYHNYHMAAPGDEFCNQHLLQSGEDKIIITSRPVQYKWLVHAWLERHQIHVKFLFMREVEDEALHSAECKRKALHRLFEVRDPSCISMAYDDRRDVVEMYKREGIPAERVFITDYPTEEWK